MVYFSLVDSTEDFGLDCLQITSLNFKKLARFDGCLEILAQDKMDNSLDDSVRHKHFDRDYWFEGNFGANSSLDDFTISHIAEQKKVGSIIKVPSKPSSIKEGLTDREIDKDAVADVISEELVEKKPVLQSFSNDL